MQIDDPWARSNTHFRTMDLECECGHEQEVEVQEERSHGTTTWFAEWDCSRCGERRDKEGWYDDDDI